MSNRSGPGAAVIPGSIDDAGHHGFKPIAMGTNRCSAAGERCQRAVTSHQSDVSGLHFSANLPPVNGSARQARRLVADALARLGQHDEKLVDRVVLVTSELVTNAILHAGTDLEIDLAFDGSSIRLEVTDSSPLPIPPPHPPNADDTSGRGLFLVDILVDEWGIRSLRENGKTVWIRMHAR
jgi:anti-sigma regulatory factor (Ser/Thr protein kinase)